MLPHFNTVQLNPSRRGPQDLPSGAGDLTVGSTSRRRHPRRLGGAGGYPGTSPGTGGPSLGDAGPRFVLLLVLSHCSCGPWPPVCCCGAPARLQGRRGGAGTVLDGVGSRPSACCPPLPQEAGLELWQPHEEASYSVSRVLGAQGWGA